MDIQINNNNSNQAANNPPILTSPKQMPTINNPAPIGYSVNPQQPKAPGQPKPTSAPLPKKVSNSPWDDELPPETPKNNTPTVIGSLDPKMNLQPKKEVPLKIPENVEEKVGQKVSAANYIGKEKLQNTPESETPINSSASAISGENLTDINNIFMPQAENKPEPVKQADKKGFSLPFFGKKNIDKQTGPKIEKPAVLPKEQSNQISPAISEQKAPIKTESKKQASALIRAFLILPGLILVFALASLLTEMGLLSIGIEKVYGKLSVEQLWGGLSQSTELALGRSALEMQTHPNYKVEGSISMTIDKSVKSDIITPLISVANISSLAKDESIIVPEKAIKTVSTDSSDDYYFTANSNSNNSNQNLNQNINSNSNRNQNSNSNSNVNLNNNLNTNSNANINSSGSSSASSLNIVEGSFQLNSSENADEANITFVNGSALSIILRGKKLMVKTNGNIDYGSTDASKWATFTIAKLDNKSIAREIFNLKTDSGFSIDGERIRNEKVGDVRCFVYQINNFEVGNSLSNIGITSDMLPTMTGEVWIGIKDKLIRKVDLKITTPISSAVRSISVNATFGDFDVLNSIPDVKEADQVPGKSAANLSGDQKRKADVNEILSALKKYKDDNQSYPISADLLKLNLPDNVVARALVPRYLKTLPQDPKTGWYYAYKSADGKTCSVSSRLEAESDPEGSLVNNVLLFLKYSSD